MGEQDRLVMAFVFDQIKKREWKTTSRFHSRNDVPERAFSVALLISISFFIG